MMDILAICMAFGSILAVFGFLRALESLHPE